jgi:hypothetical protein
MHHRNHGGWGSFLLHFGLGIGLARLFGWSTLLGLRHAPARAAPDARAPGDAEAQGDVEAGDRPAR